MKNILITLLLCCLSLIGFTQNLSKSSEAELNRIVDSNAKTEKVALAKYWLAKKHYKKQPETYGAYLEEAYQSFADLENQEYLLKSAAALYNIYAKLEETSKQQALSEKIDKDFQNSDIKYYADFLNSKFNRAAKAGNREAAEKQHEVNMAFAQRLNSNYAYGLFHKSYGGYQYRIGDYKGSGESFDKSAKAMQAEKGEDWGAALPGVLMNSAIIKYKFGELAPALAAFRKSVKAFEEINDTLNTGHAYINMASVYSSLEDLDSLRWSIDEATKCYQAVEDTNGIVSAKEYLALAYNSESKYDESLKLHLEVLDLRKGKKENQQLSLSYINISGIYGKMKDTVQQLYFIRRAHEFEESTGKNIMLMASIYGQYGTYYLARSQKDSSLYYHNKQLEIIEQQQNPGRKAGVLLSIGNVYKKFDDDENALKYYLESYNIYEQQNNPAQVAGLAHNIGVIYEESGQYQKAREYIEKSYNIRKEMDNNLYLMDSYHTLSNVYKGLGMYKESNEVLWKYVDLKDSLFTSDMTNQIAEMRTVYETQQIEDSLALSQQSEENAILEKNRAAAEKDKANADRKAQFWLFAAILIAVLLVVFFVIRSSQQRKKANLVLQSKNDEITQQNEEITFQKEIIEEKNKDILDSITYAKRLQEAILPPKKLVKENLNESFILFMPKDIVSGDFYWMQPTKDGVLYAVADCTGHGVPGAMVSMVGHNALNRAVKEFGKTKPSEILDTINDLVEETFSQSEEGVKDGMDIALCKFDPEKRELEFAGANNPLWIVSKRDTLSIGAESIEPNRQEGDYKLFEIKANKQPIGAYEDRVPFSNHKILLNEGDSVYTFSDGYADQFGGAKGKKFKYSTLKILLLGMQDIPMEAQRQKMQEVMAEWKKDYEQIDDICFIGIQA